MSKQELEALNEKWGQLRNQLGAKELDLRVAAAEIELGEKWRNKSSEELRKLIRFNGKHPQVQGTASKAPEEESWEFQRWREKVFGKKNFDEPDMKQRTECFVLPRGYFHAPQGSYSSCKPLFHRIRNRIKITTSKKYQRKSRGPPATVSE